MQCDGRWCGVAWSDVMWHGVVWRGVAWHGVAWRGMAFVPHAWSPWAWWDGINAASFPPHLSPSSVRLYSALGCSSVSSHQTDFDSSNPLKELKRKTWNIAENIPYLHDQNSTFSLIDFIPERSWSLEPDWSEGVYYFVDNSVSIVTYTAQAPHELRLITFKHHIYLGERE